MSKFFIVDGGTLDSYYEILLDQINQAHYNHPTNLIHVELSQEEMSQMAYDYALGDYACASMEPHVDFSQPPRRSAAWFKEQESRRNFIAF